MSGRTRSVAIVALMAGLRAVASCGSDCGDTGDGRVTVQLVDGQSGAFLCDGTVALVHDGHRQELLQTISGEIGGGTTCRFEGNVGDPGTYEVDVASPGYVPNATTSITIDAQKCSVGDADVIATLQPLGQSNPDAGGD